MLCAISCGNQDNTTEQIEFSWDFSKQKKYNYAYAQEVVSKNQSNKNRPSDQSNISGKGNININVKENNVADVSLADLKMEIIIFDENGKVRDTIENNAPTSVVQDMKPNGRFADNNHNMLFDLLFPLPSKKLKVGETEKIPMQIPFNASGTRLFIKGFNTLEFSAVETVDGKKCAVLKGDIAIANLTIPEGIEGTYKGSGIGKATYYFDIKERYFLSSEIQLSMHMMMDVEKSKSNISEMFFDMKSENKFKIHFENVTE